MNLLSMSSNNDFSAIYGKTDFDLIKKIKGLFINDVIIRGMDIVTLVRTIKT